MKLAKYSTITVNTVDARRLGNGIKVQKVAITTKAILKNKS